MAVETPAAPAATNTPAPAAVPAPVPAATPVPVADTPAPKPEAAPVAAPAAAQPQSLLEAAGEPPKPGEVPKPGEAQKQGAPEKYTDFKLPDGMTLDAALSEKALPVFKKYNLSQEAAQEFVSLQAEYAKSTAEKVVSDAEQQRANQIKTWQEETKKALGPEWQSEIKYAGKALDAFWSPEFRKMLTASGLGDHPLMTAGLVKMGKALSEAEPGKGSNAGIVDPAEAQKRSLFPKMYEGK